MLLGEAKKGNAISDQIYLALRQQILGGDLEGGTPLRQDDIAGQHNVSKIPVREALKRLETEGLVEFRPRRGAIVRQINDTDLLEMLDIRIALECRALELAISNMDEQDLQLIREVHEEYKTASTQEQWSELNLRFHHCLLEPCGNQQLLTLLYDIEQKMGALMRARVTQASGLERPLREHATILEACENRDVEAAVKALRAHIEVTQKEVAAFIRRKALHQIKQ